MNLTIEDISETRKKIVISFSAEETRKEEKKLLGEFGRQVRVPGFRPGKAPAHLLKGRYAKEINEELQRNIIRSAYDKAVKDSDMKIFDIVEANNEKIKAGDEGEIAFTVDITPDIKLPEYKGISVPFVSIEVGDDEVEKAIDEYRKQNSKFEVVEREAATGDYVKVSYEGSIEGEPIADLVNDKPIFGKQENTWEEAGSEAGMGVSAVTEGIVGMKAGDEKEAEMEFAEDHEVEALAGRKAIYKIAVHEVRERILPEIDDEFLEKLQVESLEDWKDRVYQALEQQKKDERRNAHRRQIAETLDQRVEFPLPESALDSETDSVLREVMAANMQRGVPESEFENHKDELYTNARRSAGNRVKMRIILGQIAEEEGVKVEQADMQNYIMSEAYSRRVDPAVLVKEYKKDEGKMHAMQQAILFEKTLDLVADQAEEAKE